MSNMRFEPPDELLANHNVLLVGYRGADGSTVLDCPEFAAAMSGDGQALFGDESLARLSDAAKTSRARLEAAGVGLTAYTILQVIQDLETARQALGYARVNARVTARASRRSMRRASIPKARQARMENEAG